MNTLKNHLLISVPHMNDTFFGKSVVYICDHNKEGAMGLIINKPINHREVEEIIKIENSQGNQLENVKIKTFFGGPVLTEKMIVLHTNTLKTENTVVITDKISISSEKDIFRKIDKNINMKYFWDILDGKLANLKEKLKMETGYYRPLILSYYLICHQKKFGNMQQNH